MKSKSRALLLAIAIALSFWAFRHFFPSDEVQIKRQLQSLSKAASIAEDDSLIAIASKADRVRSYFTPIVSLDLNFPGRGRRLFQGPLEIREGFVAVVARYKPIEVGFSDVQISVSGNEASVSLTAHAKNPKEGGLLEIIGLRFSLEKIDRRWLITRGETADPFQ